MRPSPRVTPSVLQATKQKQLSDLETRECREAFQIVAKDGEMAAKQLKRCLRALGFAVTASEARAFVYEFDYNSTHTIGLADFERVYLFKVERVRGCKRGKAQRVPDKDVHAPALLDADTPTKSTGALRRSDRVRGSCFLRCNLVVASADHLPLVSQVSRQGAHRVNSPRRSPLQPRSESQPRRELVRAVRGITVL